MSPDAVNASYQEWLTEAVALPLRFAQVREDPFQDLTVVEQLGTGVRVMMIASGGCTAALLAASGRVGTLHVVDPNPAQLALTRLKLHLLERGASPDERLAILGHAQMLREERRDRIAQILAGLELPADALGPLDRVAALGPDQAGRYELLFAELRRRLAPVAHALNEVLVWSDPAEQERRVAPDTPLGDALDVALDEVMALPNLVYLFGADATNNPAQPFSRHFAARVRAGFSAFPAATNPYLWQMLRGEYPPGVYAPWFESVLRARIPDITFTRGMMNDALGAAEPEGFDFVHLSNILDWLSPAEARDTLERAWTALRPSGAVLIRQLNSSLDIPGLDSRFQWDRAEGDRLHAIDRSFFYRALHLGRKT